MGECCQEQDPQLHAFNRAASRVARAALKERRGWQLTDNPHKSMSWHDFRAALHELDAALDAYEVELEKLEGVERGEG